MDNSVKKLVDLLEPLISDLDEQKSELEEQKSELENVSRMLAYTKDNYDMVSIYADQDLILNCLPKINSDKEAYRASCYLLNSENEDVKKLPQYKQAYNLISDIVEYFKLYKAELIVATGDLEKTCHEKELAKKYYNIFADPADLFVPDVKEFNTFLEHQKLSEEDIINILMFVLKSNIVKYSKKND